ncbi:unnamed protein product, partial [Sphacelaria rigidula]
VILQRLGTLGRLTSLLRAPSASEKILEEALSTAHRLFERLVTSARVYLDPAFLPPSVDSADATRGDDSGPRGPQRVSEGEAAAATLLSFRYPQPASSTPAPY